MKSHSIAHSEYVEAGEGDGALNKSRDCPKHQAYRVERLTPVTETAMVSTERKKRLVVVER